MRAGKGDIWVDRAAHLLLNGEEKYILRYADGPGSWDCKVEYGEAPDLLPIFLRTAEVCHEYYPILRSKMGRQDLEPPYLFSAVDKLDAAAVAYSDEKKVVLDYGHFKKNPEDIGAVIHEMAHVSVGGASVPSWLGEGLADYARYDLGFGNEWSYAHCDVPPFDHYRSGYWCAAAFLGYIQAQYLKERGLSLMSLLAQDIRGGLAGDDRAVEKLFQKYTRSAKTLEELWRDCRTKDCRGGKL